MWTAPAPLGSASDSLGARLTAQPQFPGLGNRVEVWPSRLRKLLWGEVGLVVLGGCGIPWSL